VSRTQPVPSDRRPRLLLAGGLLTLAAIAVGVFLVWFVFFSSEAPDAPRIERAAAAVAAPSAPSATSQPEASAPAAGTSSVDGRWLVDDTVGDFADFSSSWVGFRVGEVLDNIGEAEAVGRTPDVAGMLDLSGLTLEQATIEVDLTGIRSDQSRRDPAIQRALETGDFPTATFTSTAALELPAIPTEGEPIAVTVPGELTIHGVSLPVEAEMQAQVVDDTVVVVGELALDFTEFGITMPRAPIVVSVEDEGSLEWQLFFRREAA
jgi:polyisoprenoid-binding protein YceI